MLNMWPFKKYRNIKDVLFELKKIEIQGIEFTIKKIDVFNYMTGSAVLMKEYEKYSVGKKPGEEDFNPALEKKIRTHYTDVIIAGVVTPYITRKKEDTGVCVDDLFNNFELVENLYQEIIEFTYGKKKLMRLGLQRNL